MKPKYLMVFLFCLLGLCLYLFYMIYSGAKENAIAELNNRQSIHAKQAKSGIEYLFSDLITYLTKVSSSHHIINLDEQGINELGFALNLYPEAITAITRVDKKGKITFTIPYNAAVIGQDISSQKHVKKILRTRKPVISDVFTAVQGYRAIALHVPIFNDNEFRGTLAILINFSTIPKRFLQDIQIGENGYSWMTSKEGIEIYCPVPGHTGKSVFENNKELPGILSMANLMVQGEEGVASYMSDRIRDQQREMVKHHAVYLPVKIADSFWTIVVVSSEDEVLASLISLKNKLIMVVCLLLFVSSLFSYSGMKAWGIVREAAKRKKVEKALATHLQNTPIGAISWDLNFKTVEWNPAAETIFGYSKTEAMGKHVAELILPEDMKELVESVFQNILSEKGGNRSTNENITKDGRRIICDWYNTALKDDDGRSIGMASLVHDITERKQSEMALINSEHKWRNILVNTPQIGITLNTKAEIIFANTHFLKLTGWQEQEVIGQDWFDMFIPEHSREEVREVFLTVMSQKDTIGFSTYENEIMDRSGMFINVAWSNALTKGAHGNVIDVTCLGVDLTERLRSEQALKKSATKYKIMMESLKDPVYIGSKDYRIQYMNPAMMERIGYDATGEFCYKALHDFNEKCPWCENKITFQKGHTEKDIFSPKDNLSFNVSSSIFTNEDGSLSKLSVLRDTTEFKALQSRIQQSQKMESIGTLAGGIAHDFNNILFPVLGHTEMLLADVPEDSPFRESLNQIYTSAVRAKSLVKQILTFSRQESSELILMKMQPIVKEALKLIRSTIPTTIDMKQDINPDCGVIKADPTQIHQIVMNLTTNAYHAMEETGGELRVSLKEVELGTLDLINPNMAPGVYACLIVADTGKGMDKNLTDKIFDPFFTTKAIGKGTGMGLSVVHGIVTAMKGAIQAYSEPGKGTQFHVCLPVEKSLSETQVIHSTVPIQGGTEQILLVDDEEAILTMEKRMLERLGYQVTSRTGSLEALEAFRKNPDKFDLVITDMAMPNMPGDKLSVELTKIRPDISILLCTGFSENMSEEKATSLGIKGFILKPIVMKDLAQKIREVLDEERQELSDN